MKIFLSWSGERSRYLAECFKDWLPNVLQFVDPYFSKQDISLGERWSTNLDNNLNIHNFGLVFVTPENIKSPWINFESGALSKELKSRLIPMLWESDVTVLDNGPLRLFQAAKNFEKESIHDLLLQINSANSDEFQLSSERVESAFGKWWPELEESLKNTPTIKDSNAATIPDPTELSLALFEQLQIANERVSQREMVNSRRDLSRSVEYELRRSAQKLDEIGNQLSLVLMEMDGNAEARMMLQNVLKNSEITMKHISRATSMLRN